MKLILGLFGVLLLIIIIGTYSKALLFGGLGFGTPTAKINSVSFTLIEAKTEKDRQTGLSGRTSLNTNQGMLFLFDKPDTYAFWMKNMKFPLDIIYVYNGKIVQIFSNQPIAPSYYQDTQIPVITPSQKADKVLEINAGLSQKDKFKVGDTVTFSNL